MLSLVKYWRGLVWLLPLSFGLPLFAIGRGIQVSAWQTEPLARLSAAFLLLVGMVEIGLLAIAMFTARSALRGHVALIALSWAAIIAVQVSPLIWMGPDNRNFELMLALPALVAVLLGVFWLPARRALSHSAGAGAAARGTPGA